MDQVSGADAHNRRANAPSHANISMIKKNVVLAGGNVPAQQLLIARLRKTGIRVPLKKRGLIRKTQQPRWQRIIALNVLCGVGENFFRAVDAAKWAQSCLNYLQKTFGADNVLSAQLHLDERVPHLHAIVVPVTPNNRLSAAQIFNQDQANQPEDLDGVRRGNGSVPFLRRLQREYHSVCRELDPTLSEPVPGGVMTHQSVSEWREWIAQAYQEIPKLPQFTVETPTPTDRLAPQAYAQRQVDSCQQQAQQTIVALHAKAIEYDMQVASNQHMQKTVRQLDRENKEIKQQLLEMQQRFRKLQIQQSDLTLHELCEHLGLPIEQIDQKPQVILPNGQSLDLPAEPSHQPYTVHTWEKTPTILGIPMLFGLTEEEFLSGLATIVPIDQLERLAAYRDRYDLRIDLAQRPGKEIAKLVRLKPLDAESRLRLAQALQTNYGIADSWLDPGPEFLRNFEIATNFKHHLVLVHRNQGIIDGLAVNGTRRSEATGSPFEQYLGMFREEPIVIGSATALHTVVVSNFIEAFSLLSVPELTRSVRTVVSGGARLEKVVARALERPRPIVLVEYGHGRRCGRHRKLRELLQQAMSKEVKKLSPSNLRLGKPTIENIALDAQENPLLGPKLAQLIGVARVDGKSPKTPTTSESRSMPPASPVPPHKDESSIA